MILDILTTPLLHQLHRPDDVGRGNQCHVRLAGRILRMDELQLLRRYAPVGVFSAMNDAVLAIFLDDMLHPLLDVGIAVIDRLSVAKLSPQHIATERQGSCPCNVVAIVIPEGGGHVWDATIRALCLADVAHPLGI